MIPGPVDVCDSVLAEMRKPVVPHYGKEWASYYNKTVDLLKSILNTKEEVVIYNGSGTAALDALIGSVVEEGDKVLVGCNGWFGYKIEKIVNAYRGEAILVTVDWGEIITPELVKQSLESHENVKMFVLVHNETSTGVKNPVKEIGKVVNSYDCLFMVDGVSSIGGMEFNMDAWGVDLLAAASQKAIGAPPGLAIMAVSEKAFQKMGSRAKPPYCFYLNLLEIKNCIDTNKDYQPYGISLAIHNVQALRKSLELIIEEGLENRIARHSSMACLLRRGLESMDIGIVATDEDYASDTITTIRLPNSVSQKELLGFLRERCNIIVAPGLERLKDSTVRVGHMNLGASYSAVHGVLNGLKLFLGR
jgi:alanine-glyoxylate transaminase/serine-glyoxylate transaminase/serine-pyruvate transaminase